MAHQHAEMPTIRIALKRIGLSSTSESRLPHSRPPYPPPLSSVPDTALVLVAKECFR